MKFRQAVIGPKGDPVRESECGNFAIITPTSENREGWWMQKGQKHVLREEWATIGRFRTLQEAVAAADENLAIKEQVWHYFLEMAQRDIREAKKSNPDACDLVNSRNARILRMTEDAVAKELYRYAKYRAFLTTPTGAEIDPAAVRDWQAMVAGNYIHWWKRRSA